MAAQNMKDAYLRAERERPSLGVFSGKRPELTLDEARAWSFQR